MGNFKHVVIVCAMMLASHYVSKAGLAHSDFSPPENLTMKRKPIPQDGYRTFHFGKSVGADNHSGSIQYSHLARSYGYAPTGCYRFVSGELIALSGAIYQVTVLEDTAGLLSRVSEKKIPKNVQVPAHDSFTVPLRRTAGWGHVRMALVGDDTAIVVERINQQDAKRTAGISVGGKGPVLYATVKEGDIVLIGQNGHLVRGIVPYNKTTRVAGWVEFAAQPIPEAELIRDKKAYVKPMPKEDKKQ